MTTRRHHGPDLLRVLRQTTVEADVAGPVCDNPLREPASEFRPRLQRQVPRVLNLLRMDDVRFEPADDRSQPRGAGAPLREQALPRPPNPGLAPRQRPQPAQADAVMQARRPAGRKVVNGDVAEIRMGRRVPRGEEVHVPTLIGYLANPPGRVDALNHGHEKDAQNDSVSALIRDRMGRETCRRGASRGPPAACRPSPGACVERAGAIYGAPRGSIRGTIPQFF